MEFHITIVGSKPDLGAIEDAVGAVDPSALVDIDPAGLVLRVSASVDTVELLGLLDQAGYPVAQDQVFQVPSICCGGCSG